MKRYSNLVLVTCVALSATAIADNEFQRWMQQEQSDFQEYKDKRDKEFTAFLKQNWKQVDLVKGIKRDKKPKPVRMPVAKPVPVKPVPIVRDVPRPVVTPAPAPITVAPPATPVVPVPGVTKAPAPVKPAPVVVNKPQPVKPAAPKPEVFTPPPIVIAPAPVVTPPLPAIKPAPPSQQKGRRLVMDYFGETITLFYDPALRVSTPSTINKKAISDGWSKLGKADYEPIIAQLNDIRKQRKLNDWAFAMLVNDFSAKVAPSNNGRALLNWFVLIKSNFEARIAYNSQNVTLLIPTEQPLYGVTFFTFDNVRYYAADFDGKRVKLGKVYTYDGKYPGANKKLDMRLTSDMIDAGKDKQRRLSFKFKNKTYNVDVHYDRNRVDFLNSYPQMDLNMYFTAKVGNSSARSLHAQLAKHIQGMSQLDAVNFLMRFVQTAFKYKTDGDNFGEENYLFPEETLHYSYSDCEDRSILFAWLVRNLLKLEVVGLDYPGHVAAAVGFTDKVSGDAITYQGKRFVVTDPTYINANAGKTMPQYRNTRPKVIMIN